MLQFVADICNGMRRAAAHFSDERRANFLEDDTIFYECYGDPWLFFYGINRATYFVVEVPDPDDSSSKYDTSTWQKEMDENGYGSYGSGLRIGRRLAEQ